MLGSGKGSLSSLEPGSASLPKHKSQPSFVVIPPEKRTKFICAFCFGKSCKHENWKMHPNPPIKGLNCDYITPEILAMQRPSSKLIREYDIVQQFKEQNIAAIFNCQEPGEHPYCGDGILEGSGFSYDPESDFFPHGISCFNFGWPDHSITSMEMLLRITHVMNSIIKNGKKIAVHCHAGRGRTGIAICGYLIVYQGKSAEESIRLFRGIRGAALEKSSQREMIKEFELYFKGLITSFNRTDALTYEDVLKNEKKALDSQFRAKVGNYPRVLHAIEERLIQLVKTGEREQHQIIRGFIDPANTEVFGSAWAQNEEDRLLEVKTRLNMQAMEKLSDVEDVRVLTQCYLDFFDTLKSAIIDENMLDKIYQGIVNNPNFFSSNATESQFLQVLTKLQCSLISKIMLFVSQLGLSSHSDFSKLVLRMTIALSKKPGKKCAYLDNRTLIQPGTLSEFAEPFHYLYQFLLNWQKAEPDRLNEDITVHQSSLKLRMKDSQPLIATAKQLSTLGRSSFNSLSHSVPVSPLLNTTKWHELKKSMKIVASGKSSGGGRSTSNLA